MPVLPVFFQSMQHSVMDGQEEHRRLNLIIEEHAAVEFLQDAVCRHM